MQNTKQKQIDVIGTKGNSLLNQVYFARIFRYNYYIEFPLYSLPYNNNNKLWIRAPIEIKYVT